MKAIFSLFSVYIIIGFILYFFQNSFIFLPSKNIEFFAINPVNYGLNNVELINIKTEDNLVLNSWYHPAVAHNPTIIYFHGNAGHIGYRAPIIKPLIDQGYGVLLLSYRGYSQNPGSPNEQGLYKDARAAIEYLKTKNITLDCTVLLGVSLGSAIATRMSSEYKFAAIILVSPYTSLRDVAAYHYFYYPVNYLMSDIFNQERYINNNMSEDVPKLFIHSSKDRIIPISFSEKLYEQTHDPKEFIKLDNNGHNDLYDIHQYIIEFLTKYKICL